MSNVQGSSLSRRRLLASAALAAPLVVMSRGARAADKMRVVSSQKGFWDTSLVLFGQQKGLYGDSGIELDIIWSDGGADMQQAVIAGSTDFGFASGILGALSAFTRHAPIVVTNAEMTGSSDLYWYVKTDAAIKTMKDCAGKTVAFSRPGASSELVATTLLDAAGVRAKLVSAGGPGATLTQVMSGQIDVGWSALPIGLREIKAGAIRVVARGNDGPGLATQTVRVGMTNTRFAAEKPELLKRFVKATQKTIDWAYSGDEALQMYADLNHVDLATAREARDTGYPKQALALSPISNLELSVDQALKDKRINAKLSADQMRAFTASVAGLTA